MTDLPDPKQPARYDAAEAEPRWRARWKAPNGQQHTRTIPGHIPRPEAQAIADGWERDDYLHGTGVKARATYTTLDEFFRQDYWPALERGSVAGRAIATSTARLKWRHYQQHIKSVLVFIDLLNGIEK